MVNSSQAPDSSKPKNPRTNRRSGQSSRSRMRAQRTAKPKVSAAPTGQVGGQYRPLSQAQIDSIYNCAYRMLAELGMGDTPPLLMERACQEGATVNNQGRLCFSRAMVEDIIETACKSFTFYGRNEAHSIEVGGDRVYFGTGGAAVQTLDSSLNEGQGGYRPSTLKDLYEFTRLADALDNVSWFTRCCIATDVPDIFELDINTAYCLMAGTQKPVGMSFTLASSVEPVIQLFDHVAGEPGGFAKRPFCKAHISPVISPMRYGEDAFDVALACIEHRMPINAIIAGMSGATAPATLDGMLAASLAETLAALCMVNVFERGYPMIFSNWPFVIDLRTGAFSGGGGEIAWLNAAAAQLSNEVGLPSGVASSMSDSKAVDAQMGMEKSLSSLACGLAGANMVYESCGMMASLLGASAEGFVLDNEMLSYVNRVLRGAEVTEESLAFESMRQVIHGDGHFIGQTETMAAMERDYHYPQLGDRQEPDAWAESGAEDAWMRARKTVDSILSTPAPNYITPQADEAIRSSFPIQLPVSSP